MEKKRCNLKEMDCRVVSGKNVSRQHRMEVCWMKFDIKKKKGGEDRGNNKMVEVEVRRMLCRV